MLLKGNFHHWLLCLIAHLCFNLTVFPFSPSGRRRPNSYPTQRKIWRRAETHWTSWKTRWVIVVRKCQSGVTLSFNKSQISKTVKSQTKHAFLIWTWCQFCVVACFVILTSRKALNFWSEKCKSMRLKRHITRQTQSGLRAIAPHQGVNAMQFHTASFLFSWGGFFRGGKHLRFSHVKTQQITPTATFCYGPVDTD